VQTGAGVRERGIIMKLESARVFVVIMNINPNSSETSLDTGPKQRLGRGSLAAGCFYVLGPKNNRWQAVAGERL
jgi:hypothetical protein